MGWVDLWLASYLASGAMSSLTYAMVLYLLPVSLFGVSVAAAELPDMSQVEVHDPDTRRRFRLRLEDSMGRIAWYVAFTATMFIVVGDVIVAAVFERGSFDHGDTVLVWLTLAVPVVGLGLPVTATRLLQNGLYALDDARTPGPPGRARGGAVGGHRGGVRCSRSTGCTSGSTASRAGATSSPRAAARRRSGTWPTSPTWASSAWPSAPSCRDWIEYRLLSNALAWRIGRTKLAGRWLTPISIGCTVAAAVAFVAELLFGHGPLRRRGCAGRRARRAGLPGGHPPARRARGPGHRRPLRRLARRVLR